MSQLLETLKAVKQSGLSKAQLEDYFTQLSHFLADLKVEEAELKRKRALHMLSEPQNGSVAQRKLNFDGTPEGQRLLLLEGYRGAIRAELDSVKTRIYSML